MRCAALVPVLAASCAVESGPRPASLEHGGRPVAAAPLGPIDDAYVLASKLALPSAKPTDAPGLHHVFRLSEQVISGSEPEGEQAFAQLAAMGVRTIVSVDGRAPDVARAARRGLRTVHVPLEYRGLSDEQVAELAKTFRERPGPFYVHCFDGKHRGPAAAAIGRLVLDGVSREQAIAEMRQWSGTAPEYDGLYRDVATRELPSEAESRALDFDFPPARGFTGFRAAMIDVSRRDDALRRLAARDWALDPAHPELDARSEASALAQSFEAAGRLAEIALLPPSFHADLTDAAALAHRLAEQIRATRTGDPSARAASQRTLADLTSRCTTCHAAHRNR